MHTPSTSPCLPLATAHKLTPPPASTRVLQARQKGSPGEALKHLQSSQKFIRWLAITHPEQPWSSWALDVLVPHLAAMRSELYKAEQRRSAVLETQALAQPEPELPTAQDMLQWAEQLKSTALAAAASTPGSGPLAWESAVLVRDAAMVVTAMGHTALMHRGSVLLSIKASSFAATPCPKGDKCPAAGLCYGNRVERVAEGAGQRPFSSPYTSLPQPSQLQLVLPHHKTSSRGVAGVALPFTCPLACQLLEAYERRARPVLAFVADGGRPRKRGRGAAGAAALGVEEEALFVDDHGRSFTSESLCNWWKKVHRCVMSEGVMPGRRVLACMHAPLHHTDPHPAAYPPGSSHTGHTSHPHTCAHLTHCAVCCDARSERGVPGGFITLHQLRHLFITDRQDNPRAPGPNRAAAAAAMLNSPAQWTAVYDRRVKRRRMEEAVAGMAAYRAAKLPPMMLPPPPAPLPPQPQPQHDWEEGDSMSGDEGDSR